MQIYSLRDYSYFVKPNFKHFEFDVFRNRAGLNAFVLSPKQWIETTNATERTTDKVEPNRHSTNDRIARS
ncbi:hypothetical protein AGMMS4956_01920 [Bacteroidia bacterium]|nr:hypothetical protein AGMMS4956_01920 [Bacteroidia bacterium]